MAISNIIMEETTNYYPVQVGNRTIGFCDPHRKYFQKIVRLSRHLFRKLDAWGIDAEYFNEVLLPLNYWVEIWESEEKKQYRASAKTIQEKGQYLHFKGHKAQIFLPREYWILR